MIRASELVGVEATRRYDDNGDPVYSTHEQVLLALRWFGWCTAERIYEALGIEGEHGYGTELWKQMYAEHQKYSKAIAYWVKRGRVEQRRQFGVVEYRLVHPSRWNEVEAVECTRCPQPRVEGKTMCQKHLDWERDYKAKRRAA